MREFFKQPLHKIATLAIVLFVLRLIFVAFGPLDLSPDEAQYWDWSRHLDLSYYSKGPLVAWLIALSTTILGDTEVGVRFFAVLGLGLLSIMAFIIARDWKGVKAGYIAFILVNVVPLLGGGGIIMSPDVPAILCWVVALYILLKIDWNSSAPQWKLFYWIGVTIGIAGLAKYTAGVFYPLLGLFLLVDAQRRRWLLKPQIYYAGFVSLLVMIPVFYWNYLHDYASLKHVLGQAGAGSTFEPLKTLGNFFGGQLGVISPIIFLFLLYIWVVTKFKDKIGITLWWFSAPLFFGFIIKAIDAKVQPNWPVLAVFGGLILLSGWIVDRGKFVRFLFGIGIVISTIMTVIIHDTFILRNAGVEFPFKRDPLKPVMGWDSLGQAVTASALRLASSPIILTSRYQTASELAFYMPGNPNVLYVNPGYRRRNQYDYWQWPSDMEDKLFIYVREQQAGESPIMEKFIYNGFASCRLLDRVQSKRNNIVLKRANVFVCGGYKGLERHVSDKF